MKMIRYALLGATAILLAPFSALHAGDGYLNGNANSSTTDTWNDSGASGGSSKWTSDSGATYVAPISGNVYHLNGYNLKAGRIGVPKTLGPAGQTTFDGDQLIVDAYDATSGVPSSTGTGILIFEMANTTDNPSANGPRQNPDGHYRGEYTANIVTAPTTGSDLRNIRGSTGVITLKGTLILNGKTGFNLGSGVNDMRFNIESALSGTGDIYISGGSAGGGTANGFVTWAFGDMSNWHGTNISVLNKHTIAFTQDSDFYTNNPNLEIDFPSTSIGFINLSANVSVASGKVKITTGTATTPSTTALPDGIYTVTDLNSWAISIAGSGTYGIQTWASEGSDFSNTGTTYKLYVGQALPATAPSISTQPASQTVFAGSSVSFTVVATGTPAPAYQWKKDGNALASQTNATLALANVSTSDAGDYTVVVSNSAGSVTSNAATLTVQTVATLPAFTTQPQNKTSYAGTTVTFTASATGTPTPTYQWQLGGTDIAGATTTTLTRSNISASDAGSYICIATNSVGSTSSAIAVLTVTPLPTGVHAYANASASSGDNWNSAKAAAQWTFDGGTNYLAASADNTYHANGYSIRAGRIGAVLPAAAGTSTFNGATLVVDSFDAASQLTDGSAGAGGTLNFELASAGAGPRLAPTATTRGAFTANIVTAATPLVDQSRAIRGSNGITTLNGTLTLNGKTAFSIPSGVADMLFDVNSAVTGSGNIEFSGGSSTASTANGFVTWAFHDLNGWRGTSITVMHHHTISFAGPTDFYRSNPAASLTLGSAISPASGFLNIQADVSFASGKLSFVTGTTTTPVTTAVPDNVYTVASLNAYVATIVGGTSGGYVDSPLASEGSPNTLSPNYAGTTYHIYVGSPVPASLPSFSTHPQSQTLTAGASATLTAAATGVPAPTFQWKKNGADIAGATNATLAFSAIQVSDAGTYSVVATNSSGSVTSNDAVLTVNLPNPPTISTQPSNQTKLAGESVTFNVVASSSVTPTYQWQKDGTVISGATRSTLVITNAQQSDEGSYNVIVSNAGGSIASDAATLTVTASQARISTQPVSQVVGSGSNITLSVEAAGTGPLTYAWFKDGVAVAGATNSSLVLSSAQVADSGSYTVQITNSLGTVTSNAAVLQVNEISPTYLSNLSVRTTMSAQQTLIVGFVITGGDKPVLLRAAGPALKAAFDLDGYLADPKLTLYNGGVSLASNDDWGATLASTFASLGAFPFVTGSKDAALLQTVTSAKTAQAPSGSSSGTQLVEVYDAGTNNGPKLVNVSARNFCGTGNDILIAGFVIAGTGKHIVLIRGIGPGLKFKFDLNGYLADPKLTLFDSQGQQITSNDNWDSTLADTFSTLGAFDIQAGSKDAALLLELDAGVYTAQVSGADGGTGEALVEIYDATP